MSQQLPRYYRRCRLSQRQATHVINRIQIQSPLFTTLPEAASDATQRCFSSVSLSSSVQKGGNNNNDYYCNIANSPRSSWTTSKLRHSSIQFQHQPMNNTLSLRWFSSGDDDDESKKSQKEKEKKDDKKEEKPADDAPKEEEKPASSSEADAKKEDDAAAPAEKTQDTKKNEEDDDCPPWQNPLIEKDPDNQKIFAEDFAPGEEMPTVPVPPLEDPNNPDKILASPELYDLADDIVHLSMLEMKELVTKIGDHFGFEKPPFAGSGGGGGGGGDGGDDDEGGDGAEGAAAAKTAFDLKLVSFDAKSKIKVIKEVRAIAGLGLKEAKELVEGAPKVVMKDISKDQAEELQKKLEEVGATVEIV